MTLSQALEKMAQLFEEASVLNGEAIKQVGQNGATRGLEPLFKAKQTIDQALEGLRAALPGIPPDKTEAELLNRVYEAQRKAATTEVQLLELLRKPVSHIEKVSIAYELSKPKKLSRKLDSSI